MHPVPLNIVNADFGYTIQHRLIFHKLCGGLNAHDTTNLLDDTSDRVARDTCLD